MRRARQQKRVAVRRGAGDGAGADGGPAPGRFSITTGWPSRRAIGSARMRATTSMMPPAAKGTTTRIGAGREVLRPRDGRRGERGEQQRTAMHGRVPGEPGDAGHVCCTAARRYAA